MRIKSTFSNNCVLSYTLAPKAFSQFCGGAHIIKNNLDTFQVSGLNRESLGGKTIVHNFVRLKLVCNLLIYTSSCNLSFRFYYD